ncbi:MAG: Fe-S cluster assembly protein HesB [Chlorobiales bacterium]|nr:Fe-S cluster assembly protein HesB [Chlorobiales bacterium]
MGGRELKREDIEQFHKKIFDFYLLNGRVFPWRITTDRYAVMISEVMLQQTQAERVIPKFELWLRHFPDVSDLASAPLREVLSLWSGLGYNSRAVRLHRCAAIIMNSFGGIVPSQPEILKTLPGIGEYTCRSIPVFADNFDTAAVDTNIRRIMIHEFRLAEDISAVQLQQISESIVPLGRSRDWHNALMDYGALFLTSKKTGIRSLTKQSRFQGSKRWYRGRLIKELIKTEGMFLEEITEKYASCPWDLDEIISDLISEGLVECQESADYGAQPILKIKGD